MGISSTLANLMSISIFVGIKCNNIVDDRGSRITNFNPLTITILSFTKVANLYFITPEIEANIRC